MHGVESNSYPAAGREELRYSSSESKHQAELIGLPKSGKNRGHRLGGGRGGIGGSRRGRGRSGRGSFRGGGAFGAAGLEGDFGEFLGGIEIVTGAAIEVADAGQVGFQQVELGGAGSVGDLAIPGGGCGFGFLNDIKSRRVASDQFGTLGGKWRKVRLFTS